MARVLIAAPADRDAVEVLSYLAGNAGPTTAARYNLLFENLYDRLAEYPASGAPRSALGPNIRIGIVPPYIVIYEHAEDSDLVTILRIVHGRRRITTKLLVE